ncbi:hypothetical protein B7463_g11580, partial [Scytalidium lignicola]
MISTANAENPVPINGRVHSVVDEEQPLLGRRPASQSVLAQWRKQLMADVRRDWADGILLFCYLITGLLDSSSISIWGSFVSMQTVAAAVIVVIRPPTKDNQDLGWDVLVPIALLALQSPGQAVCSRSLKFNSLTSVVLTSIYCDLFSDADLFAVNNMERNRRMIAPILLLLGAILGGLFAHSSLGIAGALWTAAILKLVIVISWFFWPAESYTQEE